MDWRNYHRLESRQLNIPMVTSKVAAGFPSPAEEHVEKRLDPSDYLVDQEDATFFVTIQGESMIDVGLMPGDIAVVDKSKEPKPGNIVVAIVDGEFTVKILRRHRGKPLLLPANASGQYLPIQINEESDFYIWGVVTGSFRRFK